jgi:hypothetical protein
LAVTVDNLHGSTFRDKIFDLAVAAVLALRPAIGSGRLPRAKRSDAPEDLQAFKKAFLVFVDRLNVGEHASSASRD